MAAATWYAAVVPTGTPNPIIHKIHADMTQVLQLPEVRERLIAVGCDLVGSSPEYLAQFIRSEIVKLGRLVKASDARVD